MRYRIKYYKNSKRGHWPRTPTYCAQRKLWWGWKDFGVYWPDIQSAQEDLRRFIRSELARERANKAAGIK